MAGIVAMKDNVRFFLWTDGVVKPENKLGNIVQIGDFAASAESIDTTTLESMAKESEVGFTDNGTVELVQNLTNKEYVYMKTLMDDGTVFNWGMQVWNRKTKAQAASLTQKGMITGLTLTGFEVGGLVQVNTTVQISGALSTEFTDPIGFQVKLVTRITLSGTGTIDTDGGTTKITADVQPVEATNKTVTWSVSDPGKASVDQEGTVTAIADGAVTVTATANDGSGVTGTTQVTISNQT